MQQTGQAKDKSIALGCFEIALFMQKGFDRFFESYHALWQSFAVVGLNFIFVLLSAPYFHSAKTQSLTLSQTETTIFLALQFIIATALSLLFVYFFCKVLQRKEHFVKLVIVSNWVSIIPLLLYLPIFALLIAQTHSYDSVYPALVGLSLYGYALTAYTIHNIVKIPWELAVFMTICLLAINEFLFSILDIIGGI